MKFVIQGGKKLHGSIKVAGAKNAATPIIAATLLTDETCVIDNVPRITDVEVMVEILKSIGSDAQWTGENQLTINNRGVSPATLDSRLVKRLRSSILLTGPFLARFPAMHMIEPGGCIIGNRPLDTHFQGLIKLGVSIATIDGGYALSREALVGSEIVLLGASVTATENIMMAATLAQGTTVIKNAAFEPHVTDLVDFLISMGARIEGRGTSTLTIHGADVLHGTVHTIIPDTIEAGTFIILGVASNSEITIENVEVVHMDVILERLKSMGANLSIEGTSVKVLPSRQLAAAKIDARPYPGIPTDLQAIFGVLATQAHGLSLIFDTLFEGRMNYVQELQRMGAQAIVCDPHRVVISGPTPLCGQTIKSYDLRAGATMVIAGILASGQTTINEAEIVDRGYERIEERLRGIGADIVRVN